MRLTRFLSLTAILAVALAAGAASADEKADAKKKKQALKKQLLERKKQDEAKKPEPPPPAESPKPATARPPRDAVAVARLIDTHIDRALAENKVTPSPLCSDADFLRRVYLDITGVIPTAAKAKTFLDDPAPDKRAKLIDELLAGPGYGRHMADVWMGLLIRKESDSRRVDFGSFRDWLAAGFNANRGWDELVGSLLTATGPQDENPAIGFYLSNNSVDHMTDEVGRLFLGVQLQCAQCHDHPFAAWKQTEYWGMAQFFYKTQVGGLNTNRGQTPTVEESARPRKGKNALPESAKAVPAKFLQGEQPKLSAAGASRPVLAKWVTGADNPFFARAMANRTWALLLGRGLVNPIDDMHEGNEPSHPELLTALSKEFADSGFDLKHLVRAVCNSTAYQRSSKPTAGNEADDELFSHMAVKVLTAEQLYDSLRAVTGGDKDGGKGRDAKSGRPGAGPRDQFVQFFLGGGDQPSPTAYEAGIPQALKLMNAKVLGNPAAVRQLVPAGAKPAAVVEGLYLATLSRRPTDAEAARLAGYVAKAATPADAYGDILWALVNCSEFTMVR